MRYLPGSALAVLSLLAPAAATQAPDAAAIEPLAGSLVIVGGGKIPDGVRMRFLSRAGGEAARIAIVPTASKGADADDAEQRYLEPWRARPTARLTLVHVANRDDRAAQEAAAAAIDDATAVWLSGGDQSRLVTAYRDTPVAHALHRLLRRGGVVGGTSAGAACMSDPMIAGGRETASIAPGLGLLPGVLIDQHFSQRERLPRLRGAIADHPDWLGLGIDESTGVEVSGRRITVVGAGSVTVVLGAGGGRAARIETARQGQVLDLVQLRRAARERLQAATLPEFAAPGAGVLVIGGGGSLPKAAWTAFATAADGPVVVIGTACARPDVDVPRELGFDPASTDGIDLAVTAGAVRAALVDARGVWLAGDRPWQLLDLDAQIELRRLLRGVLDRGGVVGGGSAVATVLGSLVMRGHPLDDQIIVAEGYTRGLDLLPRFAIDAHLDLPDRVNALSSRVARAAFDGEIYGLGIDTDTAAVIRGGAIDAIHGSGHVLCVRASSDRSEVGRIELAAEDRFDFMRWAPR